MAYALITGASSGIGREMAALFAADRHDLIITARSQGKLDDMKRTLEHRYGVHVETVALDLSESDAPQQLHDYTVSQGFEVDHLSVTPVLRIGRVFSTPTGIASMR